MEGMKEIVFPYEHVGTLGYLNYSLMQGAFFFSNVGDYVWNKERSGVVIVDGIECRVNDVAINVDLDSDFESGEIYDDRDVLSDAEMVQKFLKPNMMAFLTNRRVLVGWDFTKTAVQVLMRNTEFRDWVGEDHARVLQNVYNISLAFGNSVDDNMDDIAEAGIDSTAAAATTDIGADDASTTTGIAADNAIATTGIATDDAAATTGITTDDTAATTGIVTDDTAATTGIATDDAAATTGITTDDTDATTGIVTDDTAATTGIATDDAAATTGIATDDNAATTGIATDDAAATTDIVTDDTAATTGIATDDAAATTGITTDDTAATTDIVTDDAAATTGIATDDAAATTGIATDVTAATTDIVTDDTAATTGIATDDAAATTGITTDDTAATTGIVTDDTAATTGIATDDAATTDVVEVEQYKVASVPATLKTDKAKEFYALIDSQDEDDVAAVQEFDNARHQWYAAEPAHKEVALSEYKRRKKCVQQVFKRRLAQRDFLLGRRMCAKRRRRFNSLYSIILKMYSDNWETETRTNSRHQRLQQHTRRPSPQERHKSELKKQMHAILASMRKNKRSDRNYLARSAKREAANRAKLDAITRRMDLEL